MTWIPDGSSPGEPQKRTIWEAFKSGWMRFAIALGKVNTLILLTLTYVFVIGPMALVLKLVRRDLLDRSLKKNPSYWQSRDAEIPTMDRSKHQF